MGQRDKWAMKLVVAACALLAAGALGAQEATQKTVKEWQDLAQADLDAVRELIRTAHPGALDKQNPDFARLMGAGYEEARRDVARVTDYNSMSTGSPPIWTTGRYRCLPSARCCCPATA